MISKRKARIYSIRRQLKRAEFQYLTRYKADLIEIPRDADLSPRVLKLIQRFVYAGGNVQLKAFDITPHPAAPGNLENSVL